MSKTSFQVYKIKYRHNATLMLGLHYTSSDGQSFGLYMASASSKIRNHKLETVSAHVI